MPIYRRIFPVAAICFQSPSDSLNDIFPPEFICGEKVLGACFERGSSGLHGPMGRKENNGHVGSGFDSAQKVESIGFRHHQISYDQIGCLSTEKRPALDAVAGLLNFKAAVAQIIREGDAGERLIIDHENVAAHRRVLAPGYLCLLLLLAPLEYKN
jgi:hypothetical protein